MTTPYAWLDVRRDAAASTIKAAYRRLSKMHHPDVGGDEAIFKHICEAYAVLRDPDRRAHFDATGETEAPKDTTRDRAIGLISEMLCNVMMHDNEPFGQDVIAAMDEAIRAQIEDINKKLYPLERARARIAKTAGRFKHIGDDLPEEHLFEMLLRAHKQRIEQGIAPHTDRLKVCALARELLADYEFTRDLATWDAGTTVTFSAIQGWR